MHTAFGSDWYKDALALARRLHGSQTDKAGRPYIEHLERVAAILVREFPDATKDEIQAALLHDTLEDTNATPADLIQAGVGMDALRIIILLTRWSGLKAIPYIAWIRWIASSGDMGAIRVKLADNLDNGDPRRVYEGSEDVLSTRYLPARRVLIQALGRELAA